MKSSSINASTFKLFKKGSTTKLAATVKFDAASDTATLDPTNTLRKGVTYEAVVTTEAKDLAGNQLDVAGIVAVGFAYLFGLQNTWAHALMVGSLAGVIALVLFTIGAMDHPFSGAARVGPEAFELVLQRFETSKLSEL
jgi:hypothetical protein